MPQQSSSNTNHQSENYDQPNIVGDVDTIEEEEEILDKKFKIPVWIWIFLIIAISIIALYVTMGQSPTINP